MKDYRCYQAKLELSESSHPWCCIVLKNPCEKTLLCIPFLNGVTPCKSKPKIANAYIDNQLWFSVTKQTTDAKKTN